MTASIKDPFSGEAVEEVPLTNSPLIRVLAQVRFPVLVSVEQSETIAPLQQALRDLYPILRKDQMQHLVFGMSGITPQEPVTAWRFSDTAGSSHLTLTRDFATVETVAYSSRSDLLHRFDKVLKAIDKHLKPPQLDRLGLRYVNRISGTALESISSLVREEVRGISGSVLDQYSSLAISESIFELKGARMRARWGRLPPNATVDPAAIQPIAEPSWILDLDMFSDTPGPFEAASIASTASEFAERIHKFFRWAVTPEFLRRYGGTV